MGIETLGSVLGALVVAALIVGGRNYLRRRAGQRAGLSPLAGSLGRILWSKEEETGARELRMGLRTHKKTLLKE
jgi:hypothetical protein